MSGVSRFSQLVLAGIGTVVLGGMVTLDGAQAAVIYDNQGAPINAATVSDALGFILAEDFTLAPGASTITDVHWTGIYAGNNVPATENFTVQFFLLDASSDLPPPVPFVSLSVVNPVRVDSGINIGGNELFRYSLEVAPIVLLPSTLYWMSIYSIADNSTWAWGGRITGSPSDLFAIRFDSSPVWVGRELGARLDFQLTNDALATGVPEPATLALLGLGLAGLGFSRRKR